MADIDMIDIVEELDDLITRVDPNVSSICKKAIAEILMLRSRPTYDAYHAVCKAYWKRVEDSKKEESVGLPVES